MGGPAVPVDVRLYNFNNQAGLGSFSFTITFDPAVASVLSVAQGAFLGSTERAVSCAAPVIASGSVTYGCSTTGTTPDGPTGSGVLATVTFQPGAGFGATNLVFSASQLEGIFGATSIGHTALTGGMLIGKCGDFNGDTTVTVSDFLLMIGQYGSSAGPPPTADWDPRYDLNDDGQVGAADIVVAAQQFGQSCSAT
jgi:hypothetical protein